MKRLAERDLCPHNDQPLQRTHSDSIAAVYDLFRRVAARENDENDKEQPDDEQAA